jgi:hypothetical protein
VVEDPAAAQASRRPVSTVLASSLLRLVLRRQSRSARQRPPLLIPPNSTPSARPQPSRPGALQILPLGRAPHDLGKLRLRPARRGIPQSRPEPLPIFVIAEDRFPSIPAIHHMVNRPRILDSQLARHAPVACPPPPNLSMSRSDRFKGCRRRHQPETATLPAPAPRLRCPHCGQEALRWIGFVDAHRRTHLKVSVPICDSS